MRIRPWILWLGLPAFFLGCSSSRERTPADQTPTSSGGSAGATATGGSSATGGSESASTCAQASGDNRLIDDFDDANLGLAEAEGRYGGWYSYGDTSGGTLTPPDAPELVAGAEGTSHALHQLAEGFGDWGAVVEASLSGGCYDASPYDGIELMAKGSGTVQLKLATLDTLPPEQGGVATTAYDHYAVSIDLTSDWTEHAFSWSDFRTGNWGAPKPPPLDGDRLLLIQFQGNDYDLSVDAIAFSGSAPIVPTGSGGSGDGNGGAGGMPATTTAGAGGAG